MTPPVQTVTSEQQPMVVSTIVLAFAADPMARWSWPSPHGFLTQFPVFVQAFGGKAFEHATAHCVGEGAGAALWLPPGVEADQEVLGGLMERTIDPARLPTMFEIVDRMVRYHPHEPHWYLPLIGVEPARQGRGYGSALLQHALQRIDADHKPAYLESSNPVNIPLYERHGFERMGTIQVGDSPPLVPMFRCAR